MLHSSRLPGHGRRRRAFSRRALGATTRTKDLMSAFIPESRRKRIRIAGLDLEFGHASLLCMAVSVVAMLSYACGAIDAQTEVLVEIFMLALKTCFEVGFGKWGPDLLLHHLVMVAAFGFVRYHSCCGQFAHHVVMMQTIHIPLVFKHAWVVAERDLFCKSLPALTAKRVLHSAFWPSWLMVVSYRAPFLMRAAADEWGSTSGWLFFAFSALILYMDILWTLESAISKSHGVVGPAISEPGGWPQGLTTVQPWAVAPVFAGLAYAIMHTPPVY